MKSRLVFGIGVSMLLSAGGGCSPGGPKYVDYAAMSGDQPIESNVTHLRIRNRAGKLIVKAQDGENVHIQARVQVLSGKQPATMTSFGDHVRVATEGDAIVISDAHAGQPDEDNWQLELTVLAPAGIVLEAVNSTGDLLVEDRGADVKAECNTGNLRVRSDVAGNLDLMVGAGEIQVAANELSGVLQARMGTGQVLVTVQKSPMHEVSIKCGTGSVVIDLPDDSPGGYNLATGTGSISVERQKGIRIARGPTSAAADGRVGVGGGRYVVDCSTGTIEIR